MLVNLTTARPKAGKQTITFSRHELSTIAGFYATCVAKGIWRDYAVDFTKEMAIFSMTRHAHEQPVVAVIKMPANTSTGYVFEILFDRKRISRTPELGIALNALRDVVMGHS